MYATAAYRKKQYINLLPTERKNTNNSKYLMMAICYLCSMHLQKEVKSNPKQPSCKKNVWLPRRKIQGRGQEMVVMVG